jgi:aspartyl-tRNA(Asn)/glutamyl-tRNA(Gln) amidotransferase subunit A
LNAVKKLESLGAVVQEISLPYTQYAVATYYIVVPSEISSNLARYDGIRFANARDAFGAEAKRRIILGTYTLSSGYYDAYYNKAQKVRSLIKEDFNKAFKKVDVILTPVTPTQAFKFGEKSNDPLAMYLSDIFTIPVNLAGLPAITIPPGFQLIGKPWREADILGIGQFYERISV